MTTNLPVDGSHSEELVRRVLRRKPVRRAARLGVRTLSLPLRLAAGATGVAFRTGVRIGRLPVRATAVGARRLGAVGVLSLVVGVGIGMLVAPTSGAQLRARLRTLVGGTGPLPDGEVRVAVQQELSTASRTSDLPQPEVAVHGGVVTLRGTVPHDTARLEVEAAAAGVRGVQGVVNQLVVA